MPINNPMVKAKETEVLETHQLLQKREHVVVDACALGICGITIPFLFSTGPTPSTPRPRQHSYRTLMPSRRPSNIVSPTLAQRNASWRATR
ncbi:hypothetical protein BC936DRAFT_144929, partial [Jimgerdemannia flammicorona]